MGNTGAEKTKIEVVDKTENHSLETEVTNQNTSKSKKQSSSLETTGKTESVRENTQKPSNKKTMVIVCGAIVLIGVFVGRLC